MVTLLHRTNFGTQTMPDTSKSIIGQTKEDQFIEHLTNPDSPTFLNQTASFKQINPNANGSAQPRSSELMARPEIQEKFLSSMKRYGLHDSNVNRVHGEILANGEESNRLKAVRMYHELKGRLGNIKSEGGSVVATQIIFNINDHKPQDNSDDRTKHQ